MTKFLTELNPSGEHFTELGERFFGCSSEGRRTRTTRILGPPSNMHAVIIVDSLGERTGERSIEPALKRGLSRAECHARSVVQGCF